QLHAVSHRLRNRGITQHDVAKTWLHLCLCTWRGQQGFVDHTTVRGAQALALADRNPVARAACQHLNLALEHLAGDTVISDADAEARAAYTRHRARGAYLETADTLAGWVNVGFDLAALQQDHEIL